METNIFATAFYEFIVAMAEQNRVRRRLPSDAEFLLDYMEGLPSDDSDSDFDGYDGLINDDDYLPVLPLQENFENSSSQNYFSTSNTLIPTMHFPDTIVSGLASCSSCILTTTTTTITTTYPVSLTPTTSYTYPIPSIPATAYSLSCSVTSHNTPATTDIIYTLPSNNTPTLTTSQTTVSNSNTTLTSNYVIMSSTEV